MRWRLLLDALRSTEGNGTLRWSTVWSTGTLIIVPATGGETLLGVLSSILRLGDASGASSGHPVASLNVYLGAREPVTYVACAGTCAQMVRLVRHSPCCSTGTAEATNAVALQE